MADDSPDARSSGTFGQDAVLVGATWLDSLVDAPIWIANKVTGSTFNAPLHLGADVYANQTEGQWTDATGISLSHDDVVAAAAEAESQGAVIDAARKTAGDIATNPFSIVPTWVWVVAGVAGAVASAFGVAYVVRAFK